LGIKSIPMKVLLDIQDKKANQLLNALQKLPYVKLRQITKEKADLITEIGEAVEELNLVLDGKKEARNAEDFLNEL
jgi:protein-disulfide isomerase-like protein with CxxC motif